jgi:hypothetical protein
MLFPNEVSQLDDDDPPGGDKVEDNIAPFFVPFSSTGRELLSKGADENIEKKSNSKRQTCVAASERFYSKCKEKEYFRKKGRKYYQTTRSALHRIIRIELNGEVFYRLELFACLCRRRCVEYSFNQRYALGILDILQALFSNPDCSKEGRSGSIF